MPGWRLSLDELIQIAASRGVELKEVSFEVHGPRGTERFRFLDGNGVRMLMTEIGDDDLLAPDVVASYLDAFGLSHLREDFHLDHE